MSNFNDYESWLYKKCILSIMLVCWAIVISWDFFFSPEWQGASKYIASVEAKTLQEFVFSLLAAAVMVLTFYVVNFLINYTSKSLLITWQFLALNIIAYLMYMHIMAGLQVMLVAAFLVNGVALLDRIMTSREIHTEKFS